jgi:DNA helicase-2/ATP-dependent DNA helicase PcrA
MDLHNQEQRAAIEHIAGPLLIIAGAGTGKTRVIVEKVGRLLRVVPGLQPENILALTFSDKAAAEMQQRAFERFGDEARRCRFSTFHSFCYRLLAEDSRRSPPWKAIDEIDHWIFLRRNLETLDLDHYLRISDPGRFLKDLLNFCSRCHDNLVSPADYGDYVERAVTALLAPPLPPDAPAPAKKPGRKSKAKPKAADQDSPEEEAARLREVARVYRLSEQMQYDAGLVNYGAMISRAVALLASSPELLERLQRLYRFILVDEFQDTNWAQIELLRLLAGDARNLTVVGDRKQAIYHFRGASRTSFDLFEQNFPGHQRVVLAENYRSTPKILAVAESAISRAASESVEAKPSGALASGHRLHSSKPPGRNAEVWQFPGDLEQAEYVAAEIARRVKAGEAPAYSSFAVLYRAHRYRNRLVEALGRHGVPFAIRKLAINNLPQVRDMVAALRAIGRPADSVSLVRVMSRPPWNLEGKKIGELCRTARGKRVTLSDIVASDVVASAASGDTPAAQALSRIIAFLERYRAIAHKTRLSGWLNGLRTEAGLFSRPQDEPAWMAFSEFVLRWDREKSSSGLLEEFLEYFGFFEEAGGSITLPDLSAEAPSSEFAAGDRDAAETTADLAASLPRQPGLWDNAPGGISGNPLGADPLGKVQLMTVHAAKGLEFDHVFLLHLLRGAFPSRHRRPLISFPDELLKGPAAQGDAHLEEERRLFYVALTRARSTLTLCTIDNTRQHPSPFLSEFEREMAAQIQAGVHPDLDWKILSLSLPPAALPAAPAPAVPLEHPARQSLALSGSALETYRECPLKYYFSHVWQIPVSPSAALRFGSLMHAAVRQLVERIARGPAEIDRTAIEQMLRDNWTSGGFADPVQEKKYWESGLEQLEGIARDLAANPFELLMQEKSFEFDCAGTRLVGRIDQINKLSGRTSGNEVELIEYKTGRARTQKDADNSVQLTIYARACREALNLEPASVILYNLASHERVQTQRGPDDDRELEEMLREAGSEIAAGQFSPEPGFHCTYCDYRPICPAHEDNS